MMSSPFVDKPLYDYQQFAVNWLLNRLFTESEKGGGLFLDPGLGKTRVSLTALETLMKFGEVKRCLVIAPLRPLYNVWPNEIQKWGFDMSYITLHGQHVQAMREDCQIELVNPEGLVKLKDIKGRWDMVIVDESTKFKTWNTKTRMRPLKKMLQNIPKRLILTGTPAANSLADLQAQMYIVDDGDSLGRTVTYFREMYMTKGGYLGRQWILKDSMQQQLLDAIAGKVLRMKAEDYLDMPELVTNDIWCQMSPACKKQYELLKRELCAELESGTVFAASASAAYAKCKQFANGTVYNTDLFSGRTSHRTHDEKITALSDLADELGGKPLLVGYQYTQDLERLLQHKSFRKAPFIKGGMGIKEVEDIVKKWNKGEYRVLFCQPQSVSHGMNMQDSCNDVAWFGLTDSPETYDQFYRRVYRLGVQGDQVRIHRLLTRGTVDEIMVERLSGKFATQSEFLEALKSHSSS